MTDGPAKELLTNDEIQALLEVVRSEGTEFAPADIAELSLVGGIDDEASGPQVRPIDLLRPNRLNRDQMAGLERTFQSAAVGMGAAMTERLRLELTCDCVNVEQLSFDTWADQFVGPAGVYVVRTPPFEQPMLFTVTSDLLYGAVDRVLGGSGEVHEIPTDFTVAEFTVADALVVPCLERVCECLRELVELEFAIENRTCNLSLARVIAPYEIVLSVYFQVSGKYLFGDVRLVVPLSQLEPYLGALSMGRAAGFRHAPGAMRALVARALRRVPLTLEVKFGSTTMSLRQLLRLRRGDVVVLDQDQRGQAVASISRRPKFAGSLGRHGGQLSLEVRRVMQESSDG